METNWLIIILIIVGAVAVAVILIIRNQKDEKELEKQIIEEDDISVKAEHDTELDNEDQ
jgi:preprotein translocase subunit YajC